MKAPIRIPSSIRRKQGGYVAIPYIIAAVAAGASTYAAVSQINQGKRTANNAAMQARVEGDAAKQQEIQRRTELLRALSSQNAAAGAGGVQTDGSVGAGIRRQINQNQNDLLVTGANASARQSMLSAQASNARAGAIGSAVGTLAGGATQAYSLIPG